MITAKMALLLKFCYGKLCIQSVLSFSLQIIIEIFKTFLIFGCIFTIYLKISQRINVRLIVF
jgi:hypothetical protein